MSDSKANQQLDLLSIALAVGNSLDIDEMLTSSLNSYSSALNAAWCCMIKCDKSAPDKCSPILTPNLNRIDIISSQFLEITKVRIADITIKVLEGEAYKIYEAKNQTLYLMEIPKFGMLAILRKSPNLSEKTLQQLTRINEKLATAILSCTNYNDNLTERNNYMEFIEQSPEMAFELDTEGYFTFINQKGLDLLDVSAETLNEKRYNLLNMIVPEEKDRVMLNFSRSIKESIPYPREYNIVTKTGERRTILIYTTIKHIKNKAVGLRGFAVDITDRKIIEKLTSDSKERLDMALLGSDAGLWDWNIKTGETYFNNQWFTMLGYTSGEIKQDITAWENLLHPDDKKYVYKELQQHLNGHTPIYRTEHRLRTKSGKWKWVLDTGRVTERDKDGNPLRAVGTHIDITERMEAEEALKKNLKQQEIISEISITLNTLGDFDDKINTIIKTVGEHLNVSRVYIFEDDESGETTSNTFEWCNKGITHEKDNLQKLPYSVIPSWKTILKEKGMLYSSDTNNLPDDIKSITQKENILAIIEYPMRIEGKYIGFIGFDECTTNRVWNKWELEMLRTITGIIANALERRKNEKSLQKKDEKFMGFFNLSHVGLTINRLSDGAFLDCNDALLKQLGYTRDELFALSNFDITPVEYKLQELSLLNSLNIHGKYGPYVKEYIRKNGEQYPVMLSGFLAYDENGEKVIWSEIQDISEIRQKDLEIKENEEKFRGLFELSPFGIFLSALDGKIIDCNKAFSNLCGYTKEELQHKGFSRMMNHQEYEQTRDKIISLIANNQSIENINITIKSKQGNEITIEMNGFLSNSEKNNNEQLVWGTVYDVTEDLRRQKMLVQSENKFRNLFEGSTLGIAQCTLEGKILDCNQSLSELLKYDKEELSTLRFKDIAPRNEYKKRYKTILHEIRTKGHYTPFEGHFISKTGEQITCLIQGFAVISDDNSIVIWTSIQDITEEHQKREELRLSEKRFRQLFELYPYGITITKIDGEVVDCNESVEKIFGLSKKTIIKNSPHTLKEKQEYLKKHKNTTQEILKTGRFGPFEHEILISSGEKISCVLQGFSFNDRDGSTLVCTSIQDISAEKKHNEIIRISEEKFRGLFELSPIGIALNDLKTYEFLQYNKSFLNMIGYSQEEFKKMSYWDLTPIEYASAEKAIAKQLPKTGHFGPFEKEYITKRGDRIPVLITGFLTKDINGREVVWSSIQNISELKRKTEDLRLSEKKFRELFEQLPVGVVKSDYASSKYLEFNNAFVKMLGWTKDSLLDKSYWDITPSIHSKLTEKIYEDAFNLGEFGPVEKSYIKSDGSLLPVIINGYTSLDLEGKKVVWTTVQDISAIRQNEDKLRQSEEKFRSFVENASDAILAISLQGNTLYASPNIEKILGYRQDEILSRPILDFVHPDDKLYYLKSVKDYLIRGIISENMEYRMLHKNGEWHWVQVTTSVNRDSGNNLYGIAILRDFTKYKQTQEDLKFLSLVASNTTNIIIITNKDKKIEWVNNAFTDISGYTLSEVTGHNPASFLQGPQTSAQDINRIREGIRSGKPFMSEIYNYSKEGKGYWIEMFVTPVYDENGVIQRYIAIENDITTRKYNEEQIAKLTKGIENSPTAVVITDNEGVIEYVNNRFTIVTGYTSQEAIGQTPRILRSGFQNRKFYENLWKTIKSGKNWSGEFYNLKKDGTYYWESATISPILNSNNEITHFIALKEDITERKQMYDEMLVALDKAEAATRAKSEFLAIMSHEIRTPMNGVIGMTSLLSKTPLTEEQLDYVNTIRSSGDALLTIINDILDFSKIESGRLELELHPFDIRQCVEDVVDLFWLKASQKGIDLSYYVDPNINHLVMGDITRIRQVLVNLVGNAVKFTESGEVTIRVTRISQNTSEKTSTIFFCVKDTGVGIPADKLSKLFTPFTQVDASITRRFGGTGLGLAITTRLIQMMNSSIKVESTLGAGSCFSFEIIFTKTDLISYKRNIIKSKQVRPGLAITNKRTKESIQNIFDYLKIEYTEDIDSTDIIFTDQPSFCPSGKKCILITALQENGSNFSQFSRHLLTPLKVASVVNVINTLLNIRETDSTDSEQEQETQILAEHYPISILVAEDNTINQKLMNKSLAYYGYTADIAANGLEVLQALERQSYDLIFMDLQMPEMDGLEATRNILQKYKQIRPKIVAMTASALGADKDACFAAGMDDYVSKPIKIEIIKEMIEKWCADKYNSSNARHA